MSDQVERNPAAVFLDEQPELRAAMAHSTVFPEIKKRSSLLIDDEQLYVVRGDTLGDEDELFVDSAIRGSSPEAQDQLARALFLEMDERSRSLIMDRIKKR